MVHIITGLSTGGAETMLYKLLAAMKDGNSDHLVISLIDKGTLGDEIEKLGYPVYTLDLKKGVSFHKAIKKLNNIISENKPDMIQGWMYHGNFAAFIANMFQKKKVPLVWNVRQSIYSIANEKKLTQLLIKLGGSLSRFPHKIIYNAKISASQHETSGYSPKKTIIIPNGFDTNVFKPSEENKKLIREELGLSQNTKLIGMIARYDPIKNHHNFLKAAHEVIKDFPDVQFIMAGRDIDLKNEKIRNDIETLNLQEKVHVLGERKDIAKIHSGLDVSVLPSDSEGFPNVIGESMACAVPCVATDVGDSSWVVADTGIMVPPFDQDALADGIKQLLHLSDEERRELGNRARSRIVHHFSIHSIAEQYDDLYRRLLKANL